eukprot:GHVH01011623.1.p1 GENE.GHVH01011623.1~~GHVH01011623.1.p1  ORF type:complete len:607 (+),score=67.87 GHVH01011623.1:1375-3195(+)
MFGMNNSSPLPNKDLLYPLDQQILFNVVSVLVTDWQFQQGLNACRTLLMACRGSRSCARCLEDSYAELIKFFDECINVSRNRVADIRSATGGMDQHCCSGEAGYRHGPGDYARSFPSLNSRESVPESTHIIPQLAPVTTATSSQSLTCSTMDPLGSFRMDCEFEQFAMRGLLNAQNPTTFHPNSDGHSITSYVPSLTPKLTSLIPPTSSEAAFLRVDATSPSDRQVVMASEEATAGYLQQPTGGSAAGRRFQDSIHLNWEAEDKIPQAPHASFVPPVKSASIGDRTWRHLMNKPLSYPSFLGSSGSASHGLTNASIRTSESSPIASLPSHLGASNRSTELPHLSTFLDLELQIPSFKPSASTFPCVWAVDEIRPEGVAKFDKIGFVDFADNENSGFNSQLPHISTSALVAILRSYNLGDIDRLEAKTKLHDVGSCKPCAFFHFPKKLCNSIKTCHFCHHEEHRRFSMKCWKRRRQRITKDISSQDLETVNSLTNDVTLVREESKEFYRDADFIMACRSLKLSVEGSFPASIKPLHQYYLKPEVIEMVEQGKLCVEAIQGDAMLSDEKITELLALRNDSTGGIHLTENGSDSSNTGDGVLSEMHVSI